MKRVLLLVALFLLLSGCSSCSSRVSYLAVRNKFPNGRIHKLPADYEYIIQGSNKVWFVYYAGSTGVNAENITPVLLFDLDKDEPVRTR